MRILANPNFNFIRWRWVALAVSTVVIVAGLATVLARGGPPMGIDFTGGTLLHLRFTGPVSEDDLRNALASMPGEKIVQRLPLADSDNEFFIRLPVLEATEQGAVLEEAGLRAEDLIRQASLPDFERLSREVVGPVIGADLQRKGIYATLTALAGILIYVGFRFRFTFALGAIVAVFHDILITLTMLTWFGFELSLNAVAAILTITGYSVNDTIVVFDRVRENQRLMRREPLETLVNTSVNQTLSRTIITSGTTFVAVLALFLFGGEVLRGFSFTMIVGIITGTYSTVFIAAAIAIALSSRTRGAQTQAEAQARARGQERPRGRARV